MDYGETSCQLGSSAWRTLFNSGPVGAKVDVGGRCQPLLAHQAACGQWRVQGRAGMARPGRAWRGCQRPHSLLACPSLITSPLHSRPGSARSVIPAPQQGFERASTGRKHDAQKVLFTKIHCRRRQTSLRRSQASQHLRSTSFHST